MSTEPRIKRSTRAPRSTRRPPGSEPVITQTEPKRRRMKAPALILALTGAALIGYQPAMNHVIGPMQLERAHASAYELTPEDIQENIERIESERERLPQQEFEALFDPESIESIDALSAKPVTNTENLVGGIYAPTVNLNMPIFYGLSQDVLYSGAGTMKSDQKMGEGNYALIGHNSKNPNALFAPTHRLKVGDPVYVSDKETVYTYTVSETKIVNPSDIHVIDDVLDTSILTLISCTDDSKQRVVVHAELSAETPVKDTPTDITSAFGAY